MWGALVDIKFCTVSWGGVYILDRMESTVPSGTILQEGIGTLSSLKIPSIPMRYENR